MKREVTTVSTVTSENNNEISVRTVSTADFVDIFVKTNAGGVRLTKDKLEELITVLKEAHSTLPALDTKSKR